MQLLRQSDRATGNKMLVAASLAVRHIDTRWRNMQVIREQSNNRFVCLPTGRCRGCANFQPGVADAEDFIATGARLNSDAQYKIVTLPLCCEFLRATQIGSGRRVLMKIAIACRIIMANIGEMSRPPIVGTSLRNGRNTGSTSMAMKAVAGL